MKAIQRRLQDSDPKIVYLALTMTETCMKNCGQIIAPFVTKSFMDDMISIAKGNKGIQNHEEALRLLQQWAKMFKNKVGPQSIFYDTYSMLRLRGMRFPPDTDVVEPIDAATKPT